MTHPLLTAKADNRFIIFVRDMAILLCALGAACVADALLAQPFLLALLTLAPVVFVARRYGIVAGLFVSIAIALLGFTLHTAAHRQSPLSDAWETFGSSVFLATAAYVTARLGSIEKRLIAIAATDPLTGIYNRRALLEGTSIEIRRMGRSQKPLSVVHIDLDNFKRVNDTFGHSEGDKVLCAVANVLRGGRMTDLVARVGGDEFVLLLPETSPQAARVMVDRLRVRLRDAMRTWEGVSCSMGIATYVQPPASADDLIHSADMQMYDAKRANKDGVRQVVIDGDHTTSLFQAPVSKFSEVSTDRAYATHSE